jgi:hypothetical protein
MRSALGRSPLAGDRGGHLRLSVARKRAPTDPGAATRDVSSADSPKLIDQKTCTPTMRSALGRSPLAGDRGGCLRLSVARKRAPTDPGAATRDVSSADSPKLIDQKTCTPTMRSALGRSPLAGDRCGHLRLSVARKRAPTDPGAAIRDVSSADSPKLIDRKTCTPTMRSALGRSPLAGDRRDCLKLSVARKRAPTDPGAALRDVISGVHGVRRYRLSQSRSSRAGVSSVDSLRRHWPRAILPGKARRLRPLRWHQLPGRPKRAPTPTGSQGWPRSTCRRGALAPLR